MNIKITTDSTADLPQALLEEHNISTIPLSVLAGDTLYKDGLEIKPEDVFEFYKKSGKMCSTSALNIEEYSGFFADYSKDFDAVIHISLGSKVSSSFANAKKAAQNFDNVYIVDSNSVSTGQGIVALKAAQMLGQALSVEEICSNCENIASKVDISFVVDTLEFLRKGGRCSALTELGANLLKIKPCIQVENGSLKVSKKYRGSLNKCLETYIEDKLSSNENIDLDTIFLVYSPVSAETIELCLNKLKQYKNFKNIYLSEAGCSISSHCGPGCVGIIYLRK